MGIGKKVNYTCDKCSKAEEEPDYRRQDRWTLIKSAGSLTRRPAYLLCATCHEDLERWMGVPVPVKIINKD
jgi:hypothetical protein